jgi:hypothetical protein
MLIVQARNPRSDDMLIQQGTNPRIALALDVPLLTAGVPSYGAASNYSVTINGANVTGSGSVSPYGSGPNGPAYVEIVTAVGDFPTTGPLAIWVFDGFGNLVGQAVGQVVSYDPYT